MKPKWRKSEDKIAKEFKGKRVRGSGNQTFHPGDVKTDQFLIENKITQKKSYSLSMQVLNKIYEEALFSFRIPLISIKIQEKEIVIMFKEDFLSLINSDASNPLTHG